MIRVMILAVSEDELTYVGHVGCTLDLDDAGDDKTTHDSGNAFTGGRRSGSF